MFRFLLLFISVSFITIPTFAGWTTWVTLGGEILGDPSACTARGITYVAARGLNNKIWYRKRTLSTGIWDQWKEVNSYSNLAFTGSPSIACRIYREGNYFEIVAIGAADGLPYLSYQAHDGSFTPWAKYPVTGIATGRLAAGSGYSTPRVVDVQSMPQWFAKGSNNSLYRATCFNQCFLNYDLLASQVLSDPAATFQSPGRLDLVVMATTGTLIHGFFEGGLWFPFKYINSGSVTSSPDIVSRYNGSLDLFARGPNYHLQHRRWLNGTWGAWTNLGSPNNRGITSGPGATTYASNARIFAFARGHDNALWYRAWAP